MVYLAVGSAPVERRDRFVMGTRSVAVHVFIAGALGAAVVSVAGLVPIVSASGGGTASSFVPIVPCRLVDTRPATTVGTRNTTLGAAETVTFDVWGTNGSCTIPATATGIASNVTAVGATQASYLTLFPADASQPTTSNLNPAPGQPPTPNQVTVGLSTAGAIKIYNNAGTVDVIIDIVGYYEPSAGGPQGVQGPVGPAGAQGQTGATGDPGPRPAQVVWVAKSGGDFTSLTSALASITDNSISKTYVIKVAPGSYAETSAVNLKSYVDIEGSGEGITTITCNCATGAIAVSSAVLSALSVGHIQVRHLSVTNTGGGSVSFGIGTNGVDATVEFDHITIMATGGGLGSNAVFTSGTPNGPGFNDVTATAGQPGALSASAVYLFNASTSRLNNVSATSTTGGNSYGISVATGSKVLIRDSALSGVTGSVNAIGGAGTVHVAESVLTGPISGLAAADCADNVKPDLSAFTCP